MFANTNVLRWLFFGVLMGIASVTPGLSAGVIAAAAGLYEPMVHALVNLFREFKKSIALLIPLGIGAVLGLLVVSRLILWLMAIAPHSVMFAFLGLVVGGVPSLVRQGNDQQGFQKRYLIPAGLAFGVVLVVGFIMTKSTGDVPLTTLGPLRALVSGAVLSIGTVVPGISASFLLMSMGSYQLVMQAISGFQLLTLLPFGLGFLLTTLVLIKLVDLAFQKFPGYAYYTVLGFLVGSMVLIFPGIRLDVRLLGDIALLVAGTLIGLLVTRGEEKTMSLSKNRR